MPLAPGDKLGPYEILSLIGKGGMGEVYKARDSRLGRDVAIKVLLQERVFDPERKRRFLQEARAASALNHPNIVTVYDISQDEGRDFLVMEYVRGKTLKEVIPERSLPLREVSGYGSQVASALAAAHKAGIIHRDIKSANIMVTSEGRVKVLDFGLAKLTDPVSIAPDNETLTMMALTTPGMIMGTVAYMSPEQTRGELLDARSDIFSLGCVLYEAATGRLPFQGRSALESMHATATTDPPAPSTLNPELSAEFDRVIQLAMAKDKDRRYASADELAAALEAIRGESVPARTPWRWAAAALALVAVIGGAALLSPLMRHAADPAMIAVLPFVDLGGDPSQRYFSQGVTEDIIAQLGRSGSSGFGVINGPSIWRYRDAQPTPHQLAADLAAGYVVTGSIQHENNLLRIAARLTRTRDEVQVWADSFDGPSDNVFALQRNVAMSVAKAVASQLALAAPGAPEQVEPIDSETYNLYLLGRFYWNQRTEASLKGAVDYFKQVIGRAPGYAPAHAGLADSYAALVYGCYLAPAEGFPLARAELQRARELNPRSAEVSASEGYLQMYFDWDFKAARKSLADAIALNPNYAPAYDWLGVLLTATQDFPAAGERLERARALDPASLPILTDIGFHLHYSGHNREAEEALRQVFSRDQNFPLAHFWMGRVMNAEGDCSKAVMELSGLESSGLREWQPLIAGRGFVEGACGKEELARQDLSRLEKLSQSRFVTSYGMALIYAGLGDKNLALDWLRKAFEERSHWLVWIQLDPRFQSLRSEPRFQEMVAKVFPAA